jgi:segregation and condensation protein A
LQTQAVVNGYQPGAPGIFELDVFEGPLNLLLQLIRKQEIDIYDIPIVRITEQYLSFLDVVKETSVSLAGEYLVMASTLIYIKSRMLLPADPSEDESQEEDPRLELVNQLLEYEQFRKAAGMLHDRQVIEDSVCLRGENEFEEEEQDAVDATLFDLVRAFHDLIERARDRAVLQVLPESVTLEDKLIELRGMFSVRGELLFSSFISQGISRIHLIVTFIALLEMAKLREISLYQDAECRDIRISVC